MCGSGCDRVAVGRAGKSYIARGGQMIDATSVAVPKQRDGRDENAEIKANWLRSQVRAEQSQRFRGSTWLSVLIDPAAGRRAATP